MGYLAADRWRNRSSMLFPYGQTLNPWVFNDVAVMGEWRLLATQ